MTVPYYDDGTVQLWHGDCLDILTELPDASIDAVITDPPYGLEFMGREWDTFGGGKTPATGLGDRPTPWVSNRGWNDARCRTCKHLSHGGSPCKCDAPDFAPADNRWQMFQAWCQLWAIECLRVLKPGGHLLAFGGTRTYHRLTCAIEDAGLEIRDSISWLYGSGFPKSLDVSKAIDKAAGAERENLGIYATRGPSTNSMFRDADPTSTFTRGDRILTAPATDDAKRWQGWGTALKPAHEPIVVARKPLTGTVAANVLAYGTGALNVDGCRVGTTGGGGHGLGSHFDRLGNTAPLVRHGENLGDTLGRWPPNVLLDESQAAELDRQSGDRAGGNFPAKLTGRSLFGLDGHEQVPRSMDDSGGASRFFPTFRYEPKAPAHERPKGDDGTGHPTVKPLDLMRWLVRLVTPPGGHVLDPFAGSGTTGEACIIEGFRCTLIEKDPESLPRIIRRLTKPIQPDMFGGTA